MDPIATYTGKWLDGSYRFDLFTDSLRIVGTTFLRSEDDMTIALNTLQLRVDRLRIRSGIFAAGLWMIVVSMTAYTVALEATKLDPFGLAAGLLGAPAIGGLVMTLAAARKIEIARFVTDAGVVAFGIPRTKKADTFDEFVNQILTQIRDC